MPNKKSSFKTKYRSGSVREWFRNGGENMVGV